MMLRLEDFLNMLESVAPAQWAEPWDNPGLQVGCPTQEIKTIFSSLDPTFEALIAASTANAQLLFTHHPLIFKPVSRLQTDAFPGNVIAEAARRDMAIVAAHTNLDVAPRGINAILSDLLGLRDVEVLKPVADLEGVGMGRVGNLPHPAGLLAVAKTVMNILGTADVKVVGNPDAWIRRIAVVGGAGGSLLLPACQKGADLLFTGDVGHHVALEAKTLGIALIDGGHFHSEKTAFQYFSGTLETLLKSRGWDIQVVTNEGETDPIWRCEGR